MKKEQFLQELRDSLEGEVSDQVLYENINYYRQYLEDQQREGKTEEEAIEELGQPSWIARSIIEAEEVSTGHGSPYEDDVYTQGDESGEEGSFEVHEIKWYHKLLFIIILVLLIVAIVSIAGAVLSFLGPILLTILIVYLIKRFIL